MHGPPRKAIIPRERESHRRPSQGRDYGGKRQSDMGAGRDVPMHPDTIFRRRYMSPPAPNSIARLRPVSFIRSSTAVSMAVAPTCTRQGLFGRADLSLGRQTLAVQVSLPHFDTVMMPFIYASSSHTRHVGRGQEEYTPNGRRLPRTYLSLGTQ